MKKKRHYHKRTAYVLLLALLCQMTCAVTGCGSGGDDVVKKTIYYYPKEQPTEEKEQPGKERELYLIISVDSAEEVIRLYRYANGMAYQYYYTLSTSFLDRYGNYASAAGFVPGRAVYIDGVSENGSIGCVQLADSVWEYGEVKKFSVDEAHGIFYIADEKYEYGDDLYVFSDARLSKLSELTDNDILTVIGKDRKILSVLVTTGHGKLQLLNTGLFEGSYLQLDTSIFAIITSNMQMELPEGVYTLSVANDGWGGTTEIEIERGKTTDVDLDLLKGDGPQYGNILFLVDLEDAVIRIDGEKVAVGTPVKLRYGWHALVVSSGDYEDWSKRLYVNSAEATISIEAKEGTLKKTAEKKEKDTQTPDTQQKSETETQTEEENGMETQTEAADEAETTENTEETGENRSVE